MLSYRRLDPADVTVHKGIPVTTVARTLVDLTDVLDAQELANVIHEAAYRKLFTSRRPSISPAAPGRRAAPKQRSGSSSSPRSRCPT